MPSRTPALKINAIYWLFTWILLSLHLGRFFEAPASTGLLIYQAVLIATYAALFVALPWLLSRLTLLLSKRSLLVTQILLGTLLQLLVYADNLMWTLYGFHFNGFVWNIITTPGGIEALGSSDSSYLGFSLIAAGWLAVQVVLRMVAGLLVRYRTTLLAPRWLWIAPLILLLSIGERLSYGASHFYGYSPLLETSQRMPFYQPLTMRRTLENLGFERPQRLESENVTLKGQLNYPRAPLQIASPEKPLNIVWLVGESWRADTLNPRVMPETFAFSETAQRFEQHYSVGNGTRIGMFSQFYGLPANLWFPVLDARIGSPVIDVLQQQNYQFQLFTSAKFSYPEFDKTLFVKVPPEQMQSYDTVKTWQRDRKNVTDLLRFIDERDQDRPFMTFMFFESPHANYDFPPESVIEPDYLPDFSYANMDLKRDIQGIHKRYINAVHHLDSQIARVIDHLEQRDLLDSTILIITGDHGEEFMDNGRWGHNSTFVDAQIKVPMVLWVPGKPAHVETTRTSHVDLLPTLLPLMGVRNPATDYSIGISLFEPEKDRLLPGGDWDRLAFLGERYKIVLPFSSGSFTAMKVSTANDLDLSDSNRTLQQEMPRIRQELQQFRQFLAH